MSIAVLGGGSWGTALADMLARKGERVRLWVRNPEAAREISETGMNARYLPGHTLSAALQVDSDPEAVLRGAECVLLAVPCQSMSACLRSLRDFFPPTPRVVCAGKGVELGTFRTMRQVVEEELAELSPRYSILSGPSFAVEVADCRPTAVVVGCADPDMADFVQLLFSTQYFRVYVNDDVLGVELGGAIKNIMAIASGVADGLRFGENARAALITRGLSEMSRLGVDLGARAETFMGLSGLGDLILTCIGDQSRNRRVGLAIGQGKTLEETLGGMHNVAEGVKTTQAVYELSRKRGIELPITEQVYAILFTGKSPIEAVRELMGRPLRDEFT
jgi:glycerol-3-phosphate dehydrogenase (NAD(P)+)